MKTKIRQMKTICGECEKPYSKACEQKVNCPFHRSECFSCKSCKTKKQNKRFKEQLCSQCKCYVSTDDLFTCFQCSSYFCCNHFLKNSFSSKQMSLPCGCVEITEHLLAFMTKFCQLCGRKIGKENNTELEICLPCERQDSMVGSKGQKQSNMQDKQFSQVDPKQSVLKPAEKQSQKTLLQSQQQQVMKKQEENTLNLLLEKKMKLEQQLKEAQSKIKEEQINQAKVELEESLRRLIRTRDQEIVRLLSELKKFEDHKTNVSYFDESYANKKANQQTELKLKLHAKQRQINEYKTRQQSFRKELEQVRTSENQKKKQIQQYSTKLTNLELQRQRISSILLCNERDLDCLICLQAFNRGDRQPMMICLQQHLVCKLCITNNNILMCPLCRKPIKVSQAKVSCQRSKSLELEMIIKKQCEPSLPKTIKRKKYSPRKSTMNQIRQSFSSQQHSQEESLENPIFGRPLWPSSKFSSQNQFSEQKSAGTRIKKIQLPPSYSSVIKHPMNLFTGNTDKKSNNSRRQTVRRMLIPQKIARRSEIIHIQPYKINTYNNLSQISNLKSIMESQQSENSSGTLKDMIQEADQPIKRPIPYQLEDEIDIPKKSRKRTKKQTKTDKKNEKGGIKQQNPSNLKDEKNAIKSESNPVNNSSNATASGDKLIN